MDETRTTVRFPSDRYGRRRKGASNGGDNPFEFRKPSRWLVGAAAVLAVAGGVAIAAKLYDQYGDQEFRGQVIAFDTDEDSVAITFEVFKPTGETAICQLRARSEDGAEVGYAEVPVSAEASQVTVEYTLETSAKPVTGELRRCHPASLSVDTRRYPWQQFQPGFQCCRTHFVQFHSNTSVRRMRSCPRLRTTPPVRGSPRRPTTG